jgi:serine/threonine protein phosphatase 1
MAGRLIAIGDVHGCAEALRSVLGAVVPQAEDVVITLGDYVNRGPDTCGVIEQLLELRQHCQLIPLMGNHDARLLAVVAGESPVDTWLEKGGRQTLRSYGMARDPRKLPREHLAFLQGCRKYYLTETHFFAHANYRPERDWEAQDDDTLLRLSLRDYVPGPHPSGKVAIVGHTPQRSSQPLDLGHLICLDTGCCYGGLLTAMEVGTRQLWQADEPGVG